MVANRGPDLKPSASIFSMPTGDKPPGAGRRGACPAESGPDPQESCSDATGRITDPCRSRVALASATVSAVMLTMRRTVAVGVNMCTGLAAPSSTRPMAMPPPAVVFSRL